MTNVSLPLKTHTAPQFETVTPPTTTSSSNLPNGTELAALAPAEDEPYTIKCICGFQDDDGNTVFCERCETWQHIECYYPTKKVPDVHNCVDCEPRPLDQRRATDRQKRRREHIDDDRKPKRPPAKSHKKKAKDVVPAATHINGWSHRENEALPLIDRRSDSPRDQPPPPKRTKTSHGASNSISSQAGLPSTNVPEGRRRTASAAHKAHSHSMSPPNQSPIADNIGLYSEEFMRLHRDDPGDVPMAANLFSNIGITDGLSMWCQDRDFLAQDTGGLSPHEVFQRLDQPIDELPMPDITKLGREDRSITCDGVSPRWQYLTIGPFVPMHSIVGEIKGQISHIQDYQRDAGNRWQLLEHPNPFVFFHPQLPICIDTRSEGTLCRYVRRSCRPNLEMKTILTNGTEYHFCLSAKEDLHPGTEITIGWDISDRIAGYINRAAFAPLANGLVKGDSLTLEENDLVSTWVSRVLANFGGCACDGARQCRLAQFDRRKYSAPTGNNTATTNGHKPRKPKKDRNNIAPSNPTRSLEGPLISDKTDQPCVRDDQDDNRSTSSIRSKSGSRDITPSTHFSSDIASAPSQGLSDREKRKIAAVERGFEQLEHDNSSKKKKRSSAGSNLNTPSAANSKQLGHPATTPPQTNPSKIPGRQQASSTAGSPDGSGSPTNEVINNGSSGNTSSLPNPLRGTQNASISTAKLPRSLPNYTTSSTQTEPEVPVWYNSSPAAKRKKPYISLTKSLLTRCHEDRNRSELASNQTNTIPTSSNRTDADQPSIADNSDTQTAGNSSPPGTVGQVDQDIEMRDAGIHDGQSPTNSAYSPQIEKPRPPDEPNLTRQPSSQDILAAIKPPPPPSFNGSKAPATREINGFRSTALRVQLPPTPQFSMSSTSTQSSAGTPTSTAGSVAQSPLHANSYPPAFSPSVASSVAPSPIKKKLSLSDYVNRRSKAETPAATPTAEKTLPLTSPKLPHSLLKMSSSLAEEVQVPGGLEGSAIVDTPVKEEADPLNPPKDPRLAL